MKNGILGKCSDKGADNVEEYLNGELVSLEDSELLEESNTNHPLHKPMLKFLLSNYS